MTVEINFGEGALGTDGGSGGNGGGVQIIAVGPTRNEIVNNSMKALITTKLS